MTILAVHSANLIFFQPKWTLGRDEIKMKEFFKNVMQGFSMALADSVPGVSGGTVAFVLGFYDKFINLLNTLISRKGDKKEAIKFLVKLGIGWVIGMAIALIIKAQLKKH